MIRSFTKKFKVPWASEAIFLSSGKYKRLKVVEIPDTDVDKDICTPVVIERRNLEVLSPLPVYYSVFWVDYSKVGPTVLDLLTYIRKNLDNSLTFRVSCGQGVCGLCAMNINGVNCLACTAPVTPTEQMTITTLSGFSPCKDLLSQMYKYYDTYKATKPWLVSKGKPSNNKENLQTPEERKLLDGVYECIVCGCCNSSCPKMWWDNTFDYGPSGFLQAYRWIVDTRDENKENRLKEIHHIKETDKCTLIGACDTSCPIGLNPKKTVEYLKEKVKEYD